MRGVDMRPRFVVVLRLWRGVAHVAPAAPGDDFMVAEQKNDSTAGAKKPWSAPRLAGLDDTGEKKYLNVIEFTERGVPKYTTNTEDVS